MPYTAIVNSYISAKPLFGNSINTTTQFILNVSGVFASTPVSIDSEDIVVPTVEDPDPVVIPDDPTPAPPAVMTQSLEGWSCYSNYVMHKNTVIAEVSSTDPRLAYANIYVGSCADGDDPEEYGEGYEYNIFNGEEGGWYDLPANCYGDTICAQVTFSNGIHGLVALSTAPPTISQKIMVYNTGPDACIGGWAISSSCAYEGHYPFSPIYDGDYFWADIIIMDTSGLYESHGGMDYSLNQNYEEWEPANTYTYTISGRTFYLYFVAFKPNSEEYPVTIDCDLPTLTVNFPFIICDENGDEIANARDYGFNGDAEYYYFYHTNGSALVQALVTASGLTV